jgi:hypothetical protein
MSSKRLFSWPRLKFFRSDGMGGGGPLGRSEGLDEGDIVNVDFKDPLILGDLESLYVSDNELDFVALCEYE